MCNQASLARAGLSTSINRRARARKGAPICSPSASIVTGFGSCFFVRMASAVRVASAVRIARTPFSCTSAASRSGRAYVSYRRVATPMLGGAIVMKMRSISSSTRTACRCSR